MGEQQRLARLLLFVLTGEIDIRLMADQCGDDAKRHESRHQQIGESPAVVVIAGVAAKPGCQRQCPRTRHDHRQSITCHIGGGHGRLQPLRRRLDAIGVDDDVLSGGGERHQQGEQGELGQLGLGIAEGHAHQ